MRSPQVTGCQSLCRIAPAVKSPHRVSSRAPLSSRAKRGISPLLQRARFLTSLGMTRRLGMTRGCLASRRHALQQRDLLPDLARQPRGERLDLVDGAEHHRIAEVLHEQHGDLAGQRYELAAIVEIAA